jgi:hypothetical protein
VSLLLLKLVITPSLIGAASLAGRKWGHSISGWLVALPLTTGPIVFLLALTHGTAFAASAAAGTLAGGFSQAAFALVYARLAPRLTWPPTLAAAALAFGLMTVLLQYTSFPLVVLWLAVLGAFLVVLQLLPGESSFAPLGQALAAEALTPQALGAEALTAERLPGRWDIPLRMILATAFVVLVTGLAPSVGPRLTGLLAPFPLFTATLAAFAHHQQGSPSVIKVLRGLLMGLFSYASFFFTLGLLLEPAGIAAAFAAAIVVVCAFQGATLWLLRRKVG